MQNSRAKKWFNFFHCLFTLFVCQLHVPSFSFILTHLVLYGLVEDTGFGGAKANTWWMQCLLIQIRLASSSPNYPLLCAVNVWRQACLTESLPCFTSRPVASAGKQRQSSTSSSLFKHRPLLMMCQRTSLAAICHSPCTRLMMTYLSPA